MRRFYAWMMLLALGGGAALAAPADTGRSADTSFKQALFLYKDRAANGEVFAFVDIDLARWSRERRFVPLQLTLGNASGEDIAVRLERITLTTPSGRILSPAPYSAVNSRDYGRLYQDRFYLERRDENYFGSDLSGMRRVPVFFYPEMHYDRAGGARDSIELDNLTFFQSLVYFPNEGLEPGIYTLTVGTGQGDVSVKFPLWSAGR